VREEGGTLRFVTADGCTIPRNGYRLEDFVDDDIGGDAEVELDGTSREGFGTAPVQQPWQCNEIRETAAIYRLGS
jgi:hypothetical protein